MQLGTINPLSSFFLFKIVLATLSHLHFHMNFKISLPISAKTWNWMGKINPYFSVKKNTFNVLLTSSQEFEVCRNQVWSSWLCLSNIGKISKQMIFRSPGLPWTIYNMLQISDTEKGVIIMISIIVLHIFWVPTILYTVPVLSTIKNRKIRHSLFLQRSQLEHPLLIESFSHY